MINLDNKYYIDSDKYCYKIVTKGGKDKDGNVIWKSIGYYSTMGAVINGYTNMVLRDVVGQKNSNIQDLLNKLGELHKLYDEVVCKNYNLK